MGPLAEADVFLNKINIIVAPQSAGKSCLLKTACFCDWVEKRIKLSQEPEIFKEKEVFESNFVEFHRLKGYTNEYSYIEYENDSMWFSYSWKSKRFDFSWKEEALRSAIFEVFHMNNNDKMVQNIFKNFTSMRITEIFPEEQEQNLFPPTQGVLAYRLLDWARSDSGGFLFIATHSPYIVTLKCY